MNSAPVQRRILTFDTAVYRLNAIKKAAYKFGGRCLLHVELNGERQVTLTVECADPQVNLQELVQEIHSEITDQELREVVADETVGVRNLLLAQAFSATSLIEPDQDTVNYATDPLAIAAPDNPPDPQTKY